MEGVEEVESDNDFESFGWLLFICAEALGNKAHSLVWMTAM